MPVGSVVAWIDGVELGPRGPHFEALRSPKPALHRVQTGQSLDGVPVDAIAAINLHLMLFSAGDALCGPEAENP